MIQDPIVDTIFLVLFFSIGMLTDVLLPAGLVVGATLVLMPIVFHRLLARTGYIGPVLTLNLPTTHGTLSVVVAPFSIGPNAPPAPLYAYRLCQTG